MDNHRTKKDHGERGDISLLEKFTMEVTMKLFSYWFLDISDGPDHDPP